MSEELRKIKECLEGLIIHPPFRHMKHDEIEEYIVNVLTDALNAIQKAYDLGKAEAVPEWKTIDSAPRDGTWVFLCNSKGDMAVGWDKENHPVDDWRIGPMCVFRNPTHWMPLPNPPKKG